MKRQDIQRELPAAPPSEVSGWLESVTRCLLRYGAGSAPSSLCSRLEEEWLADLYGRSGALSRLRFALGCCWASRVIAHELTVAGRAAAAAPGPRSVTLYSQADPSLLSPRAAVLLLILALHAVVIYALAAGLAPGVIEEIYPPIHLLPAQVDNVAQPPPPPPPPPELVPPKVENVEPVIPIEIAPDGNVIRDVSPATSGEQLPPVPAKVASRTLGGPGAGFPNTEDYYPAASKRIGEKGLVTVRVCVDEKGRLTANPIVAESSGSARLDDGAVKLARAGSGRYRPTTENGHAVSSCYPYRIRFQLRD